MELLVAPYHEVDQGFWSEIRELKLRGNGETAWLDITDYWVDGRSWTVRTVIDMHVK